MSNSYYREQLEEWLKTIKIEGSVIDIGGMANPVRDRLKKCKCDDYCIFDTVEGSDIVADLNDNFSRDFGYDYAFCLEVFEYIYNPVQAIKNINKLLKKKGILYISFPFIYPHHNPIESDYLRYTRRGIEKLMEIGGFEIKKIIPRATKVASLLSFFKNERMKYCSSYKGHEEVGYIVKAKKIRNDN